eukprot:1148510-Pelagomonas_calceolata.AAC.1
MAQLAKFGFRSRRRSLRRSLLNRANWSLCKNATVSSGFYELGRLGVVQLKVALGANPHQEFCVVLMAPRASGPGSNDDKIVMTGMAKPRMNARRSMSGNVGQLTPSGSLRKTSAASHH